VFYYCATVYRRIQFCVLAPVKDHAAVSHQLHTTTVPWRRIRSEYRRREVREDCRSCRSSRSRSTANHFQPINFRNCRKLDTRDTTARAPVSVDLPNHRLALVSVDTSSARFGRGPGRQTSCPNLSSSNVRRRSHRTPPPDSRHRRRRLTILVDFRSLRKLLPVNSCSR